MCQGPILGQMIRFVIPILLTNLLQQLINAADVILAGRLGTSGSDAVAAVGALLREDPRWEDGLTTNAWYLHHFATALDKPGVGAEMLKSMETYTKACGKDYLRLDCAVDNAFLNSYYEGKGYAMRGTCVDGPYEGNLREKLL